MTRHVDETWLGTNAAAITSRQTSGGGAAARSWTVPSGGTAPVLERTGLATEDAGYVRANNSFTLRPYLVWTPAAYAQVIRTSLFAKTLVSGHAVGIGFHAAGETYTMYALRYEVTSALFRLSRVVAGTTSSLATYPLAVAAGQTVPFGVDVKLNGDGDPVITPHIDGVQQSDYVDTNASAIETIGSVAIVTNGTASATTGLWLGPLTVDDAAAPPSGTVVKGVDRWVSFESWQNADSIALASQSGPAVTVEIDGLKARFTDLQNRTEDVVLTFNVTGTATVQEVVTFAPGGEITRRVGTLVMTEDGLI